MRRASILVALALLVLAAASVTRADGERPWPDEWPIVLPPLAGPLPPRLPPPAPPLPPATPAAERVLQVIEHVRSTVRETRYQHHLAVRERTGMYRWDCSLMAQWVLERASPRSVAHLARLQRPRAEDFVRTIERAPTDRFRRGWQRIERIDDVRPGDVFTWRRPDGFPSRNTGHVGFALEVPRRVPGLTNGWVVRVADSTASRHQDDTRPWPGEGGFGTGMLAFLTDGEGHATHYGWGGTLSGGYVVTPILFGRVGPR